MQDILLILTFIKPPFDFKTFFVFFEWPLKTGFTVLVLLLALTLVLHNLVGKMSHELVDRLEPNFAWIYHWGMI